MTKKSDSKKTITLEEDGLRFFGFDHLEGQEITIKYLSSSNRLILEPGCNTQAPVPTKFYRIKNGFVKDRYVPLFIQDAFPDNSDTMEFTTLTAVDHADNNRLEYYQL